jgi:hypothetical protein
VRDSLREDIRGGSGSSVDFGVGQHAVDQVDNIVNRSILTILAELLQEVTKAPDELMLKIVCWPEAEMTAGWGKCLLQGGVHQSVDVLSIFYPFDSQIRSQRRYA